MSQRGNLKGYEFDRMQCPKCARLIAFSRDRRDTRRLWLRRHKPCGKVVI